MVKIDQFDRDYFLSPEGSAPYMQRSVLYRALYFLVPACLVVLLGSLVVAAYGIAINGSLDAVILAARGQVLAVEPSALSISELTAGSETLLPLKVRNLADSPINIIGSDATCTCSRVTTLPLMLRGREVATLNIGIVPSRRDIGKPLKTGCRLVVDASSSPILVSVAVGSITANPADLGEIVPAHDRAAAP